MKRYVTGGILLTGLVLFLTGGTSLAGKAPLPSSGRGSGPAVQTPAGIQAPRAPLPSGTAVSASTADDIRDIRGPLHIPDPLMWLYYISGACLILAGAAAGWRWIRGREGQRMKSAFEIAFERLERARSLMKPETAGEFSVAVSMAIRAYIESRFNLRVTRNTTEEFMNGVASDPSGDLSGYTDLLHDFLRHCDLAKFARYALSTARMEEMRQSAWEFVDKTRPRPEEEGADQESERSKEGMAKKTRLTRLGLLEPLWARIRGLISRPGKTVAPAGLTNGSAVVTGGG